MAKFSERYGHAPVRSALQTRDVDESLRNRLWNLIRMTFFRLAPNFEGATTADYLPTNTDAQAFLQYLWHNHFKQTTEEDALVRAIRPTPEFSLGSASAAPGRVNKMRVVRSGDVKSPLQRKGTI